MKLVAVRKNRSHWRCCLLLAASLAGVAMLAAGSPPHEQETTPREISVWRRTRDGWEQPHWLMPPQPRRPAVLHPLCVAAMIAILTAMALVGHAPCTCETTALSS